MKGPEGVTSGGTSWRWRTLECHQHQQRAGSLYGNEGNACGERRAEKWPHCRTCREPTVAPSICEELRRPWGVYCVHSRLGVWVWTRGCRAVCVRLHRGMWVTDQGCVLPLLDHHLFLDRTRVCGWLRVPRLAHGILSRKSITEVRRWKAFWASQARWCRAEHRRFLGPASIACGLVLSRSQSRPHDSRNGPSGAVRVSAADYRLPQ